MLYNLFVAMESNVIKYFTPHTDISKANGSDKFLVWLAITIHIQSVRILVVLIEIRREIRTWERRPPSSACRRVWCKGWGVWVWSRWVTRGGGAGCPPRHNCAATPCRTRWPCEHSSLCYRTPADRREQLELIK